MRRRPTTKFVGTTMECFEDLFADRTRRERFALHTLLSEFCSIKAEAVSRWERGLQSIRGTSLLRVRCFLHLAGYEVVEVDGYQEPVRSLLLIVGLGVAPPYEVERYLGYERSKELTGLYNIILRNGGYSDDVAAKMGEICEEHRQALAKKKQEVGAEIRRLLKDLTAKPDKQVLTVAPPSSQPVDPLVVTSFARSIGLALSLGSMLAGNPAAAQAARQATRKGIDMQELKALLEDLLE